MASRFRQPVFDWNFIVIDEDKEVSIGRSLHCTVSCSGDTGLSGSLAVDDPLVSELGDQDSADRLAVVDNQDIGGGLSRHCARLLNEQWIRSASGAGRRKVNTAIAKSASPLAKFPPCASLVSSLSSSRPGGGGLLASVAAAASQLLLQRRAADASGLVRCWPELVRMPASHRLGRG